LLLAGLATPLVLLRAHDREFRFRVRHRSRMHAAIFPPYFVPAHLRRDSASAHSFDPYADFWPGRFYHHAPPWTIGKGAAGHRLIVGYGYMMEAFSAYYSGNEYERFNDPDRMGAYAIFYWCLSLQQLLRRSSCGLARSLEGRCTVAIAMVVSVGMCSSGS